MWQRLSLQRCATAPGSEWMVQRQPDAAVWSDVVVHATVLLNLQWWPPPPSWRRLGGLAMDR